MPGDRTLLDRLHRGFRSTYLDYSTLTAQLESWARELPDLVRLSSLGQSGEGREIWMLTVGPEPERRRPAVWVDGNLHAAELAGSSVALAVAEDAIGLHLGGDVHGLPEHVVETLREVLFHVVPRISPDGAEAVLTTGRYVRSVPRDDRPNQSHPRWLCGDVDGDGLSFLMRQEHPAGEFVESAEVPGLMLPRRLEDAGPYFKLWPEGTIENFDGRTVPDPYYLGDNAPDLNRNFPWHWEPEPTQEGAGHYPGSEPESRAILEFSRHHPNLFAWLNLHTFGGVFIRPLGHRPDEEMDREDLALYRQIGAWGEELTGYPMVSGFEEFTYEPAKPIHGDLSDFAYHQRGCISYVCELWDLFEQLGLEKPKRFVDRYSHLTHAQLVALGRWDRKENAGRSFRPWKAFEHPQLGRVEVGGVDTRVGMWNPPYERLPEVCTGQSALWMRVTAMAPRLRVEVVGREQVGAGLTRIEVRAENLGYLPTWILSSAKKLPWNEPLHADVETDGCELVDPGLAHREVGHLHGWGRGRFGAAEALYYQRSRGSGSSRTLAWTVRGTGRVTLRVGSCRMGSVETTLEVG